MFASLHVALITDRAAELFKLCVDELVEALEDTL